VTSPAHPAERRPARPAPVLPGCGWLARWPARAQQISRILAGGLTAHQPPAGQPHADWPPRRCCFARRSGPGWSWRSTRAWQRCAVHPSRRPDRTGCAPEHPGRRHHRGQLQARQPWRQLDTVAGRFATPSPHRDTAHNFGVGLPVARADAEATNGQVPASRPSRVAAPPRLARCSGRRHRRPSRPCTRPSSTGLAEFSHRPRPQSAGLWAWRPAVAGAGPDRPRWPGPGARWCWPGPGARWCIPSRRGG
jgi:hypothetical protein